MSNLAFKAREEVGTFTDSVEAHDCREDAENESVDGYNYVVRIEEV